MILNKKGSAAVEFGEKLQLLRKDKGLTQEELSSALYVSRTAVSKWESGRGYPGIDSLKQIAKYFCVSLDELLSGEQLLSIAQKEQRQKQSRLCDLVVGLLDVSAILLLLLPLFRESADGVVGGVALFALSSVSPVLKAVYCVLVAVTALFGIAILALQNWEWCHWMRYKGFLSLGLNLVCAVAFVLGLHPYAAVYMLFVLILKVILLRKRG